MQAFIDWIISSWLTILVVVGITYVLVHFAKLIITRMVKRAMKQDHFASEREERLREQTLIALMTTAFRVFAWAVAIMILLTQFGVNIGPLLAGAGVAGIAIGFGAQSLIEDFLNGFFIVFENQYRIGDVVAINGVSGTVEHLTLRETVLRDLDGNVHHIPNGTIKLATNMTMEFARIHLDIGVGYDTDIDKLEKVVNQVGEELAKNEKYADAIIEKPEFVRVNEFGDSAIMIKILGKVVAAEQWAVEGALRKELKKAFDKEGIEIPFPQRVIHKA